MGTIGLPPDTYWYACPSDLNSIRVGYEAKRRDEWERTLLLVKGITGTTISYDELFGHGEKGQREIKTKEDWIALKERFLSKGK